MEIICISMGYLDINLTLANQLMQMYNRNRHCTCAIMPYFAIAVNTT